MVNLFIQEDRYLQSNLVLYCTLWREREKKREREGERERESIAHDPNEPGQTGGNISKLCISICLNL
jgi:hypothetical protein